MADSIIQNTPDQHGFILAGTEKLYLCHLPMFNIENHMYQMTLEIQIPPTDKAKYLEDKVRNPNSYYVLGNISTDLFTISDIILGTKQTFVADLFCGLPEDPNTDTPLISNVITRINRVLYARHFDYEINPPNSLTYFMFGNDKEVFLDHYLTKERDFMDLVSLTEVPDWISKDLLATSCQVNFVGMANTSIKNNSPLNAQKYLVNYEGQNRKFVLSVGRSFFYDTSIINMPAMQVVEIL